MNKVRATVKVTDHDMLANPLTKACRTQKVFNDFLAYGLLKFDEHMLYRTSRHVASLGDVELESLWTFPAAVIQSSVPSPAVPSFVHQLG